MTLHRRAPIGVVAVLLLPLLAACGGSSKHTTVNTTVPASTTSTVGTTTTTVDLDQTKAMAGLLTLSDLPAGWTAMDNSDSSDDSGGFGGQDGTTQLAACLGVSAATLDANPPEADSPTFSSADQADTVDDQVEVYPTTAAADADFALFSSPKTPGCLVQLFNGPLKSQFTQGLDPGQTLVSVNAADKPIARVGDHRGDLEITFVIGQSGLNIKVFLDLIVVTKGRSETTLTVTQPQVLAVPLLGAQLAGVAATRMTA
jgi:hypothetical protein